MRISKRVLAEQKVEEHTELLGTPRVYVEPYDSLVNEAVNIVNSKYPDLLKQVSDIKINLSKGVFGEFQSTNPNTIWVNIRRLEDEVRRQLSGQPEDVIKKEMVNQIASTVIHEATHKSEFSQTGYSSESKPEMAEEQFRQSL